MSKWTAALVLAALILLASAATAHAELPYETIDDIQVPTSVTFGTQMQWQGHAITKVKQEGNLYIVEVARDSEPHQLPYFVVSFDLSWNYLGTVRTFNPEVERRMAEEAKRKAEEDKARQQAEQERQRQQQAQQEAERLRQEQERNKPNPEPEPTPEPAPTPPEPAPIKPDKPPTRPPDNEPTPTEPPPEDEEPAD